MTVYFSFNWGGVRFTHRRTTNGRSAKSFKNLEKKTDNPHLTRAATSI
jgi:hypothetical protein